MAYIAPYEAPLRDGRRMTVRPLTPEDAESMIDLVQQLDRETPFLMREPGEFEYTLEQETALISKRLENPDVLWLTALVEGILTGSCEISRAGSRARIRHRGHLGIALLKAYWGLGIGSTLLQRCLDWANENGMEQVELEVNGGNSRAIALYERLGFVPYGRRPRGLKYHDGTYADEIQMIRTF